jgi:biopolymer transport protein ExbB
MIISGGWMMIPMLLCSVTALAIIVERFWTLRTDQIAPRNLFSEIQNWIKSGSLSRSKLEALQDHSPLGRVLAAGLVNARQGRDIMKESLEDAANQEIYKLGRFLNLLSSIAEIAPLLGLLGTVSGMIEVFATIFANGSSDVSKLAGGISVVLINTATGLAIAIPAFFFYRYFIKRVEMLTVLMEHDASNLVALFNFGQSTSQGPGQNVRKSVEGNAAQEGSTGGTGKQEKPGSRAERRQ